jgi:hypothetical protein
LSYTYSIEKDVDLLTIDKIIPNNKPNIYQLSFIIFNLIKDTLMETGIIQRNVVNINNQNVTIRKCIDIKGKIKEAENKSLFKPIPFIENSIITVQYNPKEATTEYWYDNKPINFINKIYNNPPYSLKFFVRFNNCSIRFLNFLGEKKPEKLINNIPLRVFTEKFNTQIIKLKKHNDGLGHFNKFVQPKKIAY